MLDKFIHGFHRLNFVIFFITFLFACSRVPDGIIPEDKMQKVIVDMQLAETMINMEPAKYSSVSERKELYQSVLEKYNLTEAEFDSSIIWYGKNLDIYMQVYNMALANVNDSIKKLGNIKPEVLEFSDEDSTDIWFDSRYHVFTPNSINNLLVFDIKLTEEYSPGSIFVLGLDVWRAGVIKNKPIEILLCASQKDTTLCVSNKITSNGYSETVLRTMKTSKINHVYGYIRLDGSDSLFHKIYLDKIKLLKYKYGSSILSIKDSVESKN